VTRTLRHALAAAAFAIVTIVWMLPVLRDPAGVVPGPGADDNLTFVWNTWWMHHAVTTGQWPFWTPMLFAPWGSSLALHTHAALPALASAALLALSGGSVVAATNAVVTLNLFLNFVGAYALAFRITRRTLPAALAGFIFGCSPYLGAHLHGHFNLIAAWVLPLATLATLRALDHRSASRTLLAGLSWGSLVYVDYYYAVYAALMVCLLLTARSVSASVAPAPLARWQQHILRVIGWLLALDLVVVIGIALTGGAVLRAGPLRVSIQGTDNPIAAAGLLVMLIAAVYLGPRVRIDVATSRLRVDIRRLAPGLAVALVVSSPLLLSAAALWLNGDYTSQRYFWRSAPAGIDFATLFLGNPTGALSGHWSRYAYGRLGIDEVEQVGWLGPAVTVLCAVALLDRKRRADTRPWMVIGAVFTTWATGPYLVAAGRSVWLLLPATIVRFIPIVSNARIPARAMIAVYLSAAILAALGWQRLHDRGRRMLCVSLLALLVVDYFPAQALTSRVARPAVYDVLRAQTDLGVVCELPLGLRDGFGASGRLDGRVLVYQTLHGHPITGGFVARLSPRIRAAYQDDAILGPLLRLSDGHPLSAERPMDPRTAQALLRAHGISHVIINQLTAPADLLAYARASLPLRILAADAERTLYAIGDVTGESRPSLRLGR